MVSSSEPMDYPMFENGISLRKRSSVGKEFWTGPSSVQWVQEKSQSQKNSLMHIFSPQSGVIEVSNVQN